MVRGQRFCLFFLAGAMTLGCSTSNDSSSGSKKNDKLDVKIVQGSSESEVILEVKGMT